MKKYVYVLLVACLMFLFAAENTGEAAPVDLVEVAGGKAAFSNWHMMSFEPTYATDGDPNTYFANFETSIKKSTVFYVDLGKGYPLEQLRFQVKKPSNAEGINRGFTVSLANVRPGGSQTDGVLIHTQESEAPTNIYVNIPVPQSVSSIPYRYIVFEKEAFSGFAIAEIEAYTDATNVSADDEWWVELAANAGVVSTPAVAGYECWRASDGNLSTFWAARGNDRRSMLILDLGAMYPLRAIRYLPRDGDEFGKEFRIWASVDNEFEDKVMVYEQGATSISTAAVTLLEVPPHLQENTYRYLMVEKTNITKDLGIAHIRIYTTSSVAAKPRKSVPSIRISQNKNTLSTAPGVGTNGAFVTNGYYGNGSYVSHSTTSWSYLFVDLGQEYPVSYVAMALGMSQKNLQYRMDYQIVATNDASLKGSSITVLTQRDGVLAPTAPADDSGLLVFQPQESFREQRFRYVGVRKLLTDYGGGNVNAYLDINQLDVYTPMEGFTESVKPFAASSTNEGVSVSTNIVTMTGKPYQILVACYNEHNKLVALKNTTVEAPAIQGGTVAITATVSLRDLEGIEEAVKAKVMMVTNMEQLRPVVPASAVVLQVIPYTRFYVNEYGNDAGDGSRNAPFRTVERAREEVRKHNKNMDHDIYVNIGSGRYELDRTLKFGVEDSGSNGYRVIYRGSADNMPVLSGGRRIGGWQRGEDGIWHTDTHGFENIRELFVGGVPAVRAKSSRKITGNGNYKESGSIFYSDGFYVDKAKLSCYQNPQDIQLNWAVAWKSYMIYVKDIVQDPANSNQVIVKLENPLWGAIQSVSGTPIPKYNTGFYVENAYELLDEPGEFYFNRSTGTLSYLPRENEDMETLEVLCPQIDQIAVVSGIDYDSKVSDISFENIVFAHTTWRILNTMSFGMNQGEVPQISGVKANSTPGAVEVSWANDISVSDCRFFGITTAALSLAEGVRGSRFERNIFTDIGCGAFIAGRYYHNWFSPPPGQERANLAYRKAWTASYNYYIGAMTQNFVTASFNQEFATLVDRVWYNEPWAKEKGIRSWVKIDLDEPFTWDEIVLSFQSSATDQISEAQRSNFEVLASNDESFATYTTIATVSRAEELHNIPVGDAGRYRYIMLRKATPGPFAIRRILVLSNDRKPLGERGLCVDNVFANNYITRVGALHHGASAITAYYTENLQILHNEIRDVPYSGISLGYGWSAIVSTTAKNNKIQYNKIDGFTKHGDDGGGIYTLGNQPGTVISNNYIANQGNRYAGIYTDEGTSDITIRDNVIENTDNALFVWNSSIKNLQISETWTDTMYTRNDGTNVTLEPVRLFPAGNLPEGAAQIAFEAGLESQYQSIVNRVPTVRSALPDGYDSVASYTDISKPAASARTASKRKAVQSLLNQAQFGNLPGQYSLESKVALEHWDYRIASNNNMVSDQTGGTLYEGFMLKEAYERAVNSLKRYSLNEMIALCEVKLATLEVDQQLWQYPPAAAAQFSAELSAVKGGLSNTPLQAYLRVLELEQAYQRLESARYDASILYAYTVDGKTTMDTENHRIVITVARNRNTSEVKPVFILSDNAEIRLNTNVLDYSVPVQIPVYNRLLDTAQVWEVTVINEQGVLSPDGIVSSAREDWYSSNQNAHPFRQDGKLSFQPWYRPYMFIKYIFAPSLRFNLSLLQEDIKDGVTIIFCAQDGEGLELSGYYDKNTYYKLVLQGQNLLIYYVKNGFAELLATKTECGFVYGDDNSFLITTQKESSSNVIKIWLNEEKVLDIRTIKNAGSGGYFGIYSPNVKFKIF